MQNLLETNVLIVGGGPAGASAALSLLKYSDLKVVIIEETNLESVKIGEQVNSSIFDLLNYMGIEKKSFSENNFIQGYSNTAAWGSERIMVRDSIFNTETESFQLNREEFDYMLLEKVSEKGGIIFPRTKCLKFEQIENDYWTVELKHETKGNFSVKAKYLIDATGRSGSVCRKIGVESKRHDELTAIGRFFYFNESDMIKQDIIIESIEDGWWYCASLPDRKMTLTFFSDAHIIKEKRLEKSENWNELLSKTKHIKHKISQASSGGKPWVKNAFSQVTDISLKKNFLAVGDAAASFDPISSMGIGFAISSACHAAKAIIDADLGHENTFQHYQENINMIYCQYLETKTFFYQKEQRWSDSAFWQKRINMQRISK
ncbi:flavin-dependent dehydrogenase [Chryseobacterium ginsenosidimutans]|uniref:lysine-epsilon-oxidase maturase LodB n=1 Tax=Chryseobacterium ginsenosidimutans TaxID=687846 RepID=UPI0027803730|nr:lysine-epsilon-oxidase maturase LodB [Chryseobacterium ginsenosidimutans]MDQ0594508.1 flavin-dependent dehydrogenase [Chryseobacterium ginsenosidimutans]